jgi:hypothetical protein
VIAKVVINLVMVNYVVLNTEIVGTTTLLPNGDGSGIVKFNFTPSSGVSYKVAFETVK